MDREALTKKMLKYKQEKNFKWADVANEAKLSREFVTTAILGKMPLSENAAEKVGEKFELSKEEIILLQRSPDRQVFRGPESSTHPNVQRINEIMSNYVETINQLIEEDFGDGIISAVDFKLNVSKETSPDGDRVKLTLSGKYLPYKPY